MEEIQSCVEFLQKLIQTRSLPGEEAEVADVVEAEMRSLGYNECFRDEVGNVIGRIEGEGKAPPVMFNTHLDHVGVGDPKSWPYPPFEAVIQDGKVWGRGAVDIKGPLAAQVYGIGRFPCNGKKPRGDILVSAVVQEEIGGVGARHLLSHLNPPLVVVGEPSRNELRRGHRGRVELVLHVRGRSVHASIPEQGVNPLYVIARFLEGLKEMEMSEDEVLGRSSVAPTLIRTDQVSANVVPGEVWLTCDWRNISGQADEDIQAQLLALAREACTDGAEVDITIPVFERETYTGKRVSIPASNPAFSVSEKEPYFQSALEIVSVTLDRAVRHDVWRFATDGGHFAAAGLKVIGFGPGDDRLAHTIDEAIPIDDLKTALDINEALACQWPGAVSRLE